MFDVGESERLDMGRVYAVVSAKGGVGKTTTTTNLAAALAASGADVAVVDGDLGMANLAGSLGVDSSGATLHDVLAGEAELEAATRRGPHGMTVVPGSADLDAFARADPEGLHDVLSALRENHDYVLLDTGAGLSNDTVVPLTYVDEILLVSTTGRDALGDTEKTRQVAARLDVPVAGAVITRVDPDNPQQSAVESTLDATVLSSIPRADVVRNAGDAGEPLTTYAPGSSAAAAYRALAADLTGESLPNADSSPMSETAASATDEAVDAPSTSDSVATAGNGAVESDPASESAAAETDETTATDGPSADSQDEEEIIVAGDHEADGEPGDVRTASDDEASDEPAADPLGDVQGVDANEVADVDTADEPLIDRDGDAVAAAPTTEPTTDPEAVDAESADDEPLIETADSADDSDADGDSDEQADTDEEAATAEEADTDEGTDADETDEEEGVYTTSLADGMDDDEEQDEKKGLFGRFLG
ncbi:AAA family ATPase [Halogeometricum borinquense]|uniref:AAA family ATPase n=1 Tax=Halogeometricum borinquense TaxID=60847 RepID=A0A6C0UFJ2_9EURY|nr:cell division ATPase MinD [Halogeometricum borinquense]QIB73041.1 AAA family ATPase [Halogeometricum borinquense]QIQ77560.1 AAA family ATPase [Halogeometricum borinquense]